MSKDKMTTIFLSYARGDDEPFVRHLYEDLTTHGFKVWFDRVSMPSRNLTFHQEIRDAVAAHDRLLLVVGRKAVASEYVRQEWQFAWFEAEKVVTPILRLGDYPLAIDELKLVHAEDFRNDADYALHLKELVRILNEPPPPMGKLIAVPSLPAHYLSRTDRLIPLRDAVRSGLDSPASFGGMIARQQFHGIAGAAKHVGMHGMGGIGKSVLANLLAHDRKIREAFPDGIVWVGLGSVPVVADLMRRVHVDFGGDGAFVTEHEGKAKLKELLSDKAVFLVLDDAWRRQDIEAFDILGPRCRALITTRDAGLLTSMGGTHHLVELLSDDEALRLLALAVGRELDELPAEARMVIKQCGRLPLAVSLAGGMVAAGMSWTNLLTAFDRHKLEFFKDEHRPEQHQSLWKMIEMSVRALDGAEQRRLVELGVFPEDEAVSEKAVATLWKHTGQLDDLDTPQLLVKLKQRSLVQLAAGEPGGGDVGRVSLHDLIHDYCLRRAQVEFGKPTFLHDLLLAAYRQQGSGGWWTGPNDGYFHSHLRDHLVAAGRGIELADLLHELLWLEAKNAAGLVFDLLRDFKAATDALPKTDNRHRILRLLDEALRRDIHFIARHTHDYPQGLFQCLWNSCWWYDCAESPHHSGAANARDSAGNREHLGELSLLLADWRSQMRYTINRCWIRSRRPPRATLATGLLAVFPTRSQATQVRFSADGRRMLAYRHGHSGGGVDLIDFDRESTEHLLHSTEPVLDASFSPAVEGVVLLQPARAGSRKNRELIISNWRSEDATELDLVRGYDTSLRRGRDYVLSPAGKHFAFATPNGVFIEDIWAGKVVTRIRLEGSHVQQMCFSASGRRLVTYSEKTISIWSVPNGLEVSSFRCKGELAWRNGDWCETLCFSGNGRVVGARAGKHTISLWDASSGEQIKSIATNELTDITDISISEDAASIAASDYSDIFQVFNGNEIRSFYGHSGHVYSVTFSPDGRRIATCCSDGLIRIWDANGGTRRRQLPNHTNHVFAVKFSPKGTRFASGDYNGWRRTWDTDTALPLAEFNVNMGPNTRFCFLDEQRLVSEEYHRVEPRTSTTTGFSLWVKLLGTMSRLRARVRRLYRTGSEDRPLLKQVIVIRCAATGQILEQVDDFPDYALEFEYPSAEADDLEYEKTVGETIAIDRITGRPVGWYPEALTVVKHPDHEAVVGYGNWSIQVLKIERG